jgi:hypothetical protein
MLSKCYSMGTWVHFRFLVGSMLLGPLVFCAVFCKSLFVLFALPLYCLCFFDIYPFVLFLLHKIKGIFILVPATMFSSIINHMVNLNNWSIFIIQMLNDIYYIIFPLKSCVILLNKFSYLWISIGVNDQPIISFVQFGLMPSKKIQIILLIIHTKQQFDRWF